MEDLIRQHLPKKRNRIYTPPVVLWLMISQHLESPGTLAQAVSRVRRSRLGRLRPESEEISPYTGGYSQARSRIPVAVCERSAQYLTAGLQSQLAREKERPVYLMDGSEFRLRHVLELLEKYPPCVNQYGPSHWPMMRITVVHEARTGLAVAANWGPMFGEQAVGEQALLEETLERLPRGGTYLGDRNFGIFAIAYRVTQRQADVVLRLKEILAKKLLAGKAPLGTDRRVVWTPSDCDRQSHPDLPAEARVEGRVIVAQQNGWREPLHLFTTLEVPAAEVVKLYGLRWNVETDLRSIKQTVHLQQITAGSSDMLDKELWMAIAAYNLVRAVIFSAARYAHIPPRRLSFTHVYYLVDACLPELLASPGSKRAQRELERLIRQASRCRLPQRKKRRTYPREVWLRRPPFPLRKREGLTK